MNKANESEHSPRDDLDRMFFCLLEGDEPGGVGGSDTGPTVLHGLVRDGELSEVVTHHLGFDLHLVESLAVVDADNGAGHLGNDDHVPQMCLDDVGLLVGRTLLLLLAQLLDQGHRLALQTAREFSADSGVAEKRREKNSKI